MFTNFLRVYNFAVKDFLRNKGISLAAIFILVVTVMLATSILFSQGIASFLITQIQNKIDITAYFKEDVKDQDILIARDELLKSEIVKDVTYVSREDALKNFTERYKDNDVFTKALAQVGDNPLLPSLNIKTNGDPAQYQAVADILQKDDFKNIIDSVDFSQKKDVINKVYSIRSAITKTGLILGIILIIIAILVVFNTIKLTVDSLKEEISTMKIVGASNWFIRGPFIILGAIYGFIAFIICFIISGLFFYFLAGKILEILPGFNSFDYFLANAWIFILIQVIFGVGTGVVSSFLAVRKYLKI